MRRSCGAAVLFVFAFSLLSQAEEVKIPASTPETSLSYLTYKLGMKTVFTNIDKRRVSSFTGDTSEPDATLAQYQLQNADFLRLDFVKESNAIICYDKETENVQTELLKSRLVLDADKIIYAILPEGKMRMDISSTIDDPHGDENIIRNMITQRIATNPSTTVIETIMAVLKEEKINTCRILASTAKNCDNERQIIEEILDCEANSVELKEMFKKILRETDITSKNETLTLVYESNDFGREPTLDEIATFLKSADDKLYELSCPDGTMFSDLNLNFWFERLLTFQPEKFLKYLFDKNIFNAAAPYASEMYLAPIPSFLAAQKDYNAISLMLHNLHKIKSEEKQKDVVESLVNLDKTRLSPESLKTFLNYAKKFKIERIYIDSSKWVGDDLPDNYDRWKNFKVPDIELGFERDKSIDKTRYHLKFFKHKEPVKIGGTPLKKVEETDYSTPEKAYLSGISARTYEWSKASVYDVANYNEDDFSLYRQWKRWHSGINPFILILYKVEISRSGEQANASPDLFLLIKLLNDDNMIAAIPMKLDGRCWKFYISRSQHADKLGNFIEQEILKIKSR
jgi:hypothetical protein